jgi:hypothetical protein
MPDEEQPSLMQHAMDRARESVAELEDPEDDILPILMWQGPYGIGLMPITEMADDAQKDQLAEMMTTVLAVSRATEAVMQTTGWTVKVAAPDGKLPPRALEPPPSQHPDRIECITVMHHTAEKRDSMRSAVITRYPDKPPELGDWGLMGLPDSEEPIQIGGRFGDAVHRGFEFSEMMPQELADIIDEGWRENKGQEMIERFHRVFTGFTRLVDGLQSAQEASDE